MTISEARETAEFWRGVLNLPEWSITVRWGTRAEMKDADGGDTVGLCIWSPEELTGQMMLARKQDNHEQTIIHELLHLVLEGHKPMNGRYSEMHERAINRIADGLLGLKRS